MDIFDDKALDLSQFVQKGELSDIFSDFYRNTSRIDGVRSQIAKQRKKEAWQEAQKQKDFFTPEFSPEFNPITKRQIATYGEPGLLNQMHLDYEKYKPMSSGSRSLGLASDFWSGDY